MKKTIYNITFKLALGGKKIYVYDNRTDEKIDVIYLNYKVLGEADFESYCYSWSAKNVDITYF